MIKYIAFNRRLGGPSCKDASMREASESRWAYAALLWKTVWDPQFRFLHVPKTGGSLIEQVDLASGAEALNMMHPLPSWALANVTSMSACPCASKDICISQLWHLSPHQLRACGVPTSPYSDRSVYCIMRDPIDRFVSELLYQERLCRHWPNASSVATEWKLARRRCLGEPCPGLTGGPADSISVSEITTRLVRCFASFTHDQVAGDQGVLAHAAVERPAFVRHETRSGAQKHVNTAVALAIAQLRQRSHFAGEVLHLQPQSRYVTSPDGGVECNRVFTFDDLRMAQMSDPVEPRPWNFVSSGTAISTRARQLLEDDAAASSLVRSLYAEDLEMWARVVARRAPTPRHEPLAAAANELRRNSPLLAAAPPNCTWPSCTCAHCCRARRGLRSTRACMSCLLDKHECGGLGPQPADEPRMPRAASLVCTPYTTRDWNWLRGRLVERHVACNTCAPCCGGQLGKTPGRSGAVSAPATAVFTGAMRHVAAWRHRRGSQEQCDLCDARERCAARAAVQ